MIIRVRLSGNGQQWSSNSATVKAPKADVVMTKPTGGRIPMTVENLQMFAEKPKAYSNSRPNYAKGQIEEVFENAKKKMEVK